MNGTAADATIAINFDYFYYPLGVFFFFVVLHPTYERRHQQYHSQGANGKYFPR